MLPHIWLSFSLSSLSILSVSGVKRDLNVFEDGNESLEVVPIHEKRAKLCETVFIENLKLAAEFNQTRFIQEHLESYGIKFFLPENSELLHHLVVEDNHVILNTIFDYLIKDSESGLDTDFDLFLLVIKFAINFKRIRILENLINLEYMPSSRRQYKFVKLVLKMDYPKAFKIAFKAGFRFGEFRSNGRSLGHFIAKRDWTFLIEYLTFVGLFDSNGRSVLFYAKSPKMVRLIRHNFLNLRDRADNEGRYSWQHALSLQKYDIFDAMISFDARIRHFRSMHLDYYKLDWVRSASLLKIDRSNLISSSYNQVCKYSTIWYQPNHKYFIKFIGDVGFDAGGLKYEWMTALIKAFFTSNPEGSASEFKAPLFVVADEGTGLFAPNIKYPPEVFRFAGSIIAVAMMMGVSVGYKFIPALYKFIMEIPLDIESDMMRQSPDTWRSLNLLLDPSINITDMQLHLLSNQLASVTRRIVPKYINEYAEEVLLNKYKRHIEAFKLGFESSIPNKVNLFFRQREFEEVLFGKPAEISKKEFLEFFDLPNESIKTFMNEFLDEIDAEQRIRLLRFLTGVETLLIFQIRNAKIYVTIDHRLAGKFPVVSSCIPILKLPPLDENFEDVKEKLKIAIMEENIEGFHNEPGVAADGRDGIELVYEDLVTEYLEFSDFESDVELESSEDDEEEE